MLKAQVRIINMISTSGNNKYLILLLPLTKASNIGLDTIPLELTRYFSHVMLNILEPVDAKNLDFVAFRDQTSINIQLFSLEHVIY